MADMPTPRVMALTSSSQIDMRITYAQRAATTNAKLSRYANLRRNGVRGALTRADCAAIAARNS